MSQKEISASYRKPNPEYEGDKPLWDWAMTIMNPIDIIGKRQPSLFPQPSTTCRSHQIGTLNVNATGYAGFLLCPGVEATNVAYTYNDVAMSDSNSSTGTALLTLPFNTVGHPLRYGAYRIVSSGIKVWLTTPYINSTGTFITASMPYGSWNSTDMLNTIGDLPTHQIWTANETAMCFWTPLDISCQNYQDYAGIDITNNIQFVFFKGAAGTSISYEINVNYEVIPKLNIDSFSMGVAFGNANSIWSYLTKAFKATDGGKESMGLLNRLSSAYPQFDKIKKYAKKALNVSSLIGMLAGSHKSAQQIVQESEASASHTQRTAYAAQPNLSNSQNDQYENYGQHQTIQISNQNTNQIDVTQSDQDTKSLIQKYK